MENKLFGKPVIDQKAMKSRIRSLGTKIARDYEGKNLLIVGVLKGAFAFFADLARAIPIPLQVDFLVVSRQKDKRRKDGGVINIISDISSDLKGRDVLIIEDIVDSGHTLLFLKNELSKRQPASLKFCTLLNKPERRKVDVTVHYICFEIPDRYVVGYGLDYKNRYRNLPYIASLDNIIAE